MAGSVQLFCLSFKNVFVMIAPIWLPERLGKNHLVDEFQRKTVSIGISCSQCISICLHGQVYSARANASWFSGVGDLTVEVSIWNGRLQQRAFQISLPQEHDVPTFHQCHEVECRPIFIITTVFID